MRRTLMKHTEYCCFMEYTGKICVATLCQRYVVRELPLLVRPMRLAQSLLDSLQIGGKNLGDHPSPDRVTSRPIHLWLVQRVLS